MSAAIFRAYFAQRSPPQTASNALLLVLVTYMALRFLSRTWADGYRYDDVLTPAAKANATPRPGLAWEGRGLQVRCDARLAARAVGVWFVAVLAALVAARSGAGAGVVRTWCIILRSGAVVRWIVGRGTAARVPAAASRFTGA